jgi:heme exporter protein D
VKNQTAGPIALQLQLFQGGFEDFLNLPSHSKEDVSQAPGPDRLSMLDDLIYYWITEQPSVFNRASPSLLSMSYYPLKIAAAEWKNFEKLMKYSAEDYESSIEALQFSFTDIGRLETFIRYLQGWRRRSREAASKVSSLTSFIKFHNANSSYSEVWASVAQDYENIDGYIDSYGRRLEAMGPVVTSLVQIVDSRRSFAETANLSRLTYLALVFVPLTYVASLFSMTGTNAPGGKAFWVYFAVAIPLLGLVLSIALPHQSGVPQIAEFLRGLTRRWRRPREEGGA